MTWKNTSANIEFSKYILENGKIVIKYRHIINLPKSLLDYVDFKPLFKEAINIYGTKINARQYIFNGYYTRRYIHGIKIKRDEIMENFLLNETDKIILINNVC